MKYAWLFPVVAFSVLGVGGCGPNAPVKMEKSIYAKQTKDLVLAFVREAKENPKALVGRAEVLLETLQAYANREADEKDSTDPKRKPADTDLADEVAETNGEKRREHRLVANDFAGDIQHGKIL